MPGIMVHIGRPSLWIADSDPGVSFAVQLLAQQSGFAETRIFACKQKALTSLQTAITKPTLLVTDYLSGQMRGDEFIRSARHASPITKLILFSAVAGNTEGWIDVAGINAPRPDAIFEKPSARQLMTGLCQMK